MFVDEVVQKTFLEVGEKGTEAAAATAVVMKRGGRTPPATAFQADRPFAFALRDLKTGLVLFAGESRILGRRRRAEARAKAPKVWPRTLL